MECHYSCQTCSTSVYLYRCLSCPSTRTLLGSTCICNGGLYQRQQVECIDQSEQQSFVNRLYGNFITFGDALYIVNIVIFWIYVIIVFCRGSTPYMRVIINYAQICSLIMYLPFRLDQASQTFIKSLSAFNFEYFAQLYDCDATGLPTICKGYENLFGMAFIALFMAVAFLISTCIMSMFYFSKLSSPPYLSKYLKQTWPLLAFNVLDLSAIFISLSLSRILLTSKFALILIFFFIVLYVLVLKKYFIIVNSKEQAYLQYRQKNIWAYTYDQKYHLYYIDFIYDQQSGPEEDINQSMDNFVEQAQNIFTGRKEDNTKAFFPSSNLLILEIVWKILIGAGVVLLFQYKPSLLVYPTLILILIQTFWLGAFFSYEKVLWWTYVILGIITFVCYSIYWLNYFWPVSISIAIIFTGGALTSFIILWYTCKTLDEKLVNQLFGGEQHHQEIVQSEQQSINKQQQIKNKRVKKDKDDDSQEDLVLFKPTNDLQHQKRKQQLMRNIQAKKMVRQPTEDHDDLQTNKKMSLSKLSKRDITLHNLSQPKINESGEFKNFGTIKPSSFQKKNTERKMQAIKKANQKKSVENIFEQPEELGSDNISEQLKSVLKEPSRKSISSSSSNIRQNQQGKQRNLDDIDEQKDQEEVESKKSLEQENKKNQKQQNDEEKRNKE